MTELEQLTAAITALIAPPGPDEADRLVDLLTDAVGLAWLGQPTEPVRKAGAALGQADTVELRAYLNGAAIHALDFDDTHEPSLCHTGAVMVPGLLGLAAATHRSGRDVFTAFAAGLRFVDLIAPLGPLLNQRGLHSTGIVGTLGAAVADAVLLGGEPPVVTAAVEIAATMAAGLCAAFGSEMKPLQAGRAAEAGVRAASLARHGLTYPAQALLGPTGVIPLLLGPQAVDRLDWKAAGDQAITNVAVKAYPSCYLTHSAIDAATQVRDRLGIRTGHDIRSARLTVHPIATELADKTSADSELEAKFSLRYCLLAALTRDTIGIGTFTRAGRAGVLTHGPAWTDWLSRVQVVADPMSTRLRAVLDIEHVDGHHARVTVAGPRGGIGRPLHRAEVREKFLSNSTAGPQEAADLLSRVDAVADAADLADLPPLLPN
ncbi:MmgE/PrpD family protein [Streptomyces sp. DW26H14]|uniref:MmgE/PrpD family protein n=1 Tax=Streptomyces sp. DW26H14 TaxID=3435395 RepID=UPI00403DDC0D